MAREVERLTDRKVKNLKTPGYHHDGAGLYLQVSPSETKSWIFRFTLHGKTREMGLGGYPTFTLSEVREDARKQRQLLTKGIDPIDARDAQKQQDALKRAKTLTFAECAERYIKDKIDTKKRNPKHVAQWRSTLDAYCGPVFGKLPVRAIDHAMVMRALEPIWTKLPETASRIRGRIEKVLGWAGTHGYREGDNPARWKGHLENLLPKKGDVHTVAHHPALPHTRISEFMVELRQQPGAAARALEFAILTAARSGEVRFAKLAEFDIEKGIWKVPGERMKGRKEHRVPLPARALEIVKEQPKGAFLFHSDRNKNKALSDMALTAVLRRMKKKGIDLTDTHGNDAVVHGFRSTFRDWAAEKTEYPREMCEVALAHSVGTEVERAYLRSDLFEKRRRLMREWASYCNTPKVTPIRKSA